MSIEVKNIHKGFGDFKALDNVSLKFPSGELVALLGPSGCGKTTLLRIIAGLETADKGTVLLDGEDASCTHVRERQVGFVFQHYALFKHMTVFDNVAFGLRVKPKNERLTEEEIAKKVHELLNLVQLDWLHDRFPSQLSGGQRQRIALARALAISPKVLLLDEPLSALDAKVRTQLREEIRRIQLELGTTTLFVTHDQEEALSIADRVGVMRNGQLEQIAAPSELYDRPKTSFVAEFVGLTNPISGKVSGGSIEILGSVVKTLPGSVTSGTGIALVRPESIDVVASKSGNAKVAAASFLGASCRLNITMNDGAKVTAQLPSSDAAGIGAGATVSVSLLDMPVFVKAAG